MTSKFLKTLILLLLFLFILFLLGEVLIEDKNLINKLKYTTCLSGEGYKCPESYSCLLATNCEGACNHGFCKRFSEEGDSCNDLSCKEGLFCNKKEMDFYSCCGTHRGCIDEYNECSENGTCQPCYKKICEKTPVSVIEERNKLF